MSTAIVAISVVGAFGSAGATVFNVIHRRWTLVAFGLVLTVVWVLWALYNAGAFS